MSAIEITRQDLSISQLRTHAITCLDLVINFYRLHDWREYSRTVGFWNVLLLITASERYRSIGRIMDCLQNIRQRRKQRGEGAGRRGMRNDDRRQDRRRGG
jgi:hypothetical protein